MGSLFQQSIENHVSNYLASDEFKARIRRHVTWAGQGFERGFGLADRERFTQTVAARIRAKARRPIYCLGKRIWRARYSMTWCLEQAEMIVTEFLRGDKIKFGDPRYVWSDGHDLADEEMSYWEQCP